MQRLENIIVFTDGACTNNGKKNAKGGIGVYFPNKELDDISESFYFEPATNQRTELYAIYAALELILSKFTCDVIYVYSDSTYAINCITIWAKKWERNGWISTDKKPVKNLDIIQPLYKLIKGYNIKFNFVKAHTGDETIEAIYNDRADKLAKRGIS